MDPVSSAFLGALAAELAKEISAVNWIDKLKTWLTPGTVDRDVAKRRCLKALEIVKAEKGKDALMSVQPERAELYDMYSLLIRLKYLETYGDPVDLHSIPSGVDYDSVAKDFQIKEDSLVVKYNL